MTLTGSVAASERAGDLPDATPSGRRPMTTKPHPVAKASIAPKPAQYLAAEKMEVGRMTRFPGT